MKDLPNPAAEIARKILGRTEDGYRLTMTERERTEDGYRLTMAERRFLHSILLHDKPRKPCVVIPETKNEGEKIWGRTTPLIVKPFFEMHHLSIKPMHRCSMHVHQFKHNAFYVLDGTLFIDSEIGGTKESRALGPGQVYTVAPGVPHQFRTDVQACWALEMYFPEALSEDIIRQNVGGPV